MRLRLTFAILLCSLTCQLLPTGPAAAQTCSLQTPEFCEQQVPPVIVEVFRGGSIFKQGPVIRASGGVLFMNCKRKVTATDITYDTETKTGTMKDVVFTTCDHDQPDYHFTARELKIVSGNKLHAKRASLYFGRFKVITLPFIKINVSRSGVATGAFPIPRIDKNDGLGISQKLRLVDSNRMQADADIHLTTKRGFEGDFSGIWGVDGRLLSLPGRFLSYESLRSSALTMPRVYASAPCAPEDLRPKGEAHLRQFATFTMKQRTYDIRNTGLLVYRQPEVGVQYVANQFSLGHSELDPRLEMYPTMAVSWGRFKENPGTAGLTGRTGFTAALPVNFLPTGRWTSIQPVFMYSTSTYQNGDAYKSSGYGIDASKLFPDGSLASLRYIKRSQSGVSPFIFDTVDIFSEFQGAFQVRLGKHVVGFILGYNGDEGKPYDWQVLYGYHTDCMAGWITYDSRLSRLMFDTTLINM